MMNFGVLALLFASILNIEAKTSEKFNIVNDLEGSRWSVNNKYDKFGVSGQLSIGSSFPIVKCSSEGFCRESNTKRVEIISSDSCLYISTTSEDVNGSLEDCIDLGSAHWFGGTELYDQYWPLENLKFKDESYITKESKHMAVIERYWLNSNGIYIYVDAGVPLFIDQNNRHNNSLCFIAKNRDPYLPRPTLALKYSVCGLNQGNARDAHYDAIERFLHKPTGVPDERMVRHPVWSTWARYKSSISEAKVLQFADEIVKNGFNNSQLEIDDLWETCYGSLIFDTQASKFPNMTNLSLTLKSQGFRVTLWVHPFINNGCEPYRSFAESQSYLVKNVEGSVETHWWNGKGSIIDFTNSDAVNWWVGNLHKLMENELIDSFKFDAGETSWLPQVPTLNAPVEQQPDVFTVKFSEACSQFGDFIEVRVGHLTQHLPIFVRMLDKDSRWGYINGLKTLVTTLLQMNMVGYPFVLPDMIGGNGYLGRPSKELFIRWLQANTFMPTLQFSYVPWDFDQETVDISKKFTKLHDDYTDTIMALMEKAVVDGSPINPPIWWVDPEDSIALVIDDEFLLGETVLVAPVLEKDATSRDIYLPRGIWTDNVSGQEGIVGPIWLVEYPAPLDTLPYFTRVAENLENYQNAS